MVFKVAIDGPSASGKSSIAKKVAQMFGFVHINTGLMYRAVAYKALTSKTDIHDEAAIVKMLETTQIRLLSNQSVIVDNHDVSAFLRDEEVSMAASTVSLHGGVRAKLVAMQQAMANESDCIMDGRDIGTVVLPDADVKIFITADVFDRAQRRYLELKQLDQSVEYTDVLEDIQRRDEQDTNREIGPLKQADDAIRIDTTNNEFDESLQLVVDEVRKVYFKKEQK